MNRTNIYKVNKLITLKLEGGRSNIYVNGYLFQQCKYLLLDVPLQNSQGVDNIDSIDEASELLDHSMEFRDRNGVSIPPEVEFWGEMEFRD